MSRLRLWLCGFLAFGGLQGQIDSSQTGWVVETPHFRVVAGAGSGLGGEVVEAAANHLELVRERLERMGFSPRRPTDEPRQLLLLPTVVELRELIPGRVGPRTRGLTVRGPDRTTMLVAWHAPGDPLVAAAHEYAHHLDSNDWPSWFREGRAEYLSRVSRFEAPHNVSGPAREHIERLRDVSWAEFGSMIGADEDDLTPLSQLFYAQSWLLFDWLASQPTPIALLRPDVIDELPVVELEEHLSRYLTASAGDLPSESEPKSTPAYRAEPAEGWEAGLIRARVRRQAGALDRAGADLRALAAAYPDVYQIEAALGRLHVAAGSLESAESYMGEAVRLGDPTSLTAHRYALLLMRPGAQVRTRAAEAVRQASRALERLPSKPEHHLTLAQAAMLSRDWSLAFRALGDLARFPGWSSSAAREAEEVRRRRFQLAGKLRPPELRTPAQPLAKSPTATYLAATARPPTLPPPPATLAARKPARRWPPAGATIAYGRIGWVDCTGGERKIILSTPRYRIVLRENLKKPPDLYHPPLNWTHVPCETRGWEVNIAYRRLKDAGEVKGEVLAILF